MVRYREDKRLSYVRSREEKRSSMSDRGGGEGEVLSGSGVNGLLGPKGALYLTPLGKSVSQ